MYALLFVLDDPERLDELLTAWADIGVRGVTIMESTGWQRRRIQQSMLGARFDFASLAGGARLENHMTLFVVVENRNDGAKYTRSNRGHCRQSRRTKHWHPGSLAGRDHQGFA